MDSNLRTYSRLRFIPVLIAFVLVPFAARADQGSEALGEVTTIFSSFTGHSASKGLLNIGSKHGLLENQVLITKRWGALGGKDSSGLWVPTGQIKLIELGPEQSLFEIIGEESSLSRQFYPDFPGLMVNDKVYAEAPLLVPRLQIVPTKEIRFADLFIDPKAYPLSYELSSKGKEELRAQTLSFKSLHFAALFVEAYTDAGAKKDVNQVESQQRATAVRQYLIDELGFSADRVIALGLGEAEQVESTVLAGSEGRQRRIVLKVKAQVPKARL